jgi:hypothetical protein
MCAQVGTTLHQQKISATQGGFTGNLVEVSAFGRGTAGLGDLNGDGATELAVAGARSTWILSLNPDGHVVSQVENHPGERQQNISLARVGDVDGDGITDLALGYYEGIPPIYFVEIMFLNADGTLKGSHEIAASDPVFVPAIAQDDAFGYGLAGIGDVNADGVPDLAVGAPYDDDGPGVNNGALWIVRLKPDGSVKLAQKISELRGGGSGVIDTNSFGFAIAPIGDLNGDGNPDLLVSNPGAEYVSLDVQRLSLMVLFLDQNERLLGKSEIGQEEFGLVDSAGEVFSCRFGYSLAALGDIDRDGTIEFATGAAFWALNPGAPRVGAVLIGSLRHDGTLARRVMLSSGIGGFTTDLLPGTGFGSALSLLGDLDGDGNPELAVGAYYDDDGLFQAGSAWVAELRASAVRNGSGTNPMTLTESGEPAIGQAWDLSLDCSGHAGGLAQISAYAHPDAGRATVAGELLVDLTSTRFFRRTQAHTGTGSALFHLAVPSDPALIGLAISVQGIVTGAPGAKLSNALDVVVGN